MPKNKHQKVVLSEIIDFSSNKVSFKNYNDITWY